MQWEVTGADTTTGQDRTVVIEADDAASATRRGNRAGLMVAGVRPVDIPDDSLAPAAAPATRPRRVPPLPPPDLTDPGQPYAPEITPHQMMAYAQQVDARNATGPNGVGIASLVVGCVALLLGLIPCIGIFTIPLAIIGLGLGIAGWIAGSMRTEPARGFAIAGTATSALALIVPFILIAVFYHVATNNALAARTRAQQMQANAQANFQNQQAQMMAQVNAPPPARKMNPPAAVTVTPFGSDARLGVASVRIVSAAIGPVDTVNAGGVTKKSAASFLTVKVALKNLSTTKRVMYRPFAGNVNSPEDDNVARLVDDAGNLVPRSFFDAGYKPAGRVEAGPVAPGAEVTEVIVFAIPLDSATDLKLYLPGRSMGSRDPVCLDLPASSIEKQ